MEYGIRFLNGFFYMPAPWIVIFILIYRKVFKTKGKASNKILLWYTLGLLTITTFYTINFIFFPSKEDLELGFTFRDYLQRATGPYWYAFISQYVAPFIFCIPFLFKKARLKTRWILLALLSMTFAAWFEYFIIMVTSIHRDNITDSWTENNTILNFLLSPMALSKVLLGFIYASIIFFTVEFKGKASNEEILDHD